MKIIIPRKKQHDSDKLVRSIDGPTWATIRPICNTWLSFGRRRTLWCVCTRMKILSTPTASTKNGITWNYLIKFSMKCQILEKMLHSLKITGRGGEGCKNTPHKDDWSFYKQGKNEVWKLYPWNNMNVQEIQNKFCMLLQINTYLNDDEGCWNTNKTKQANWTDYRSKYNQHAS